MQQGCREMFVQQRTSDEKLHLMSFNDLPEFNHLREALRCDYVVVQSHGTRAGAGSLRQPSCDVVRHHQRWRNPLGANEIIKVQSLSESLITL